MNDSFNGDVPKQPAQRFCGSCGAVLFAGDAGCAKCMQAEANALDRSTIAAPDRPSFNMAMALFAVLLASFLPFALAHLNDDLKFIYTIGNAVQIFDTLVVLGFVIYCWQAMYPIIKTAPLAWCLAAIPTGVITIAIATLFIGIVIAMTGIEEIMVIQSAFDAGYGWTFLIFSIVIQPAIVEELAFRGIIFDGVRKVLSDTETVAVTALMFMVLHLNPAAFPHLLIMGLLLGWIRLKTRSIWPCILLHATHNGLAILYEYRAHL